MTIDDRPVPHLAAILLMPAVFAIAIVVAPIIGSLGLVWLAEFAIVAVICFLLPALVAARATTGSVRGALGLRWPSAPVLVGALLVGATFWYLNLIFVAPLLAEHASESDRALASGLAESYPLAVEVIILSLVPAVCEEILVRGAIARGLAGRFGPAAAVLLSSGYFALLHLSLARALPTLVLGALLAMAVLRTGSVLPGILIHALNNAAAVLLADPWSAPLVQVIGGHPELALATASAGSATGLFLLLRRR
jgi:membrane protease YdiL (CAAX protease family)